MEMKTGVYHIKKYKDWIEFVKKLFPDSGDYFYDYWDIHENDFCAEVYIKPDGRFDFFYGCIEYYKGKGWIITEYNINNLEVELL